MDGIWYLVYQCKAFAVINAATQTPLGMPSMTALLLASVVAAGAANIALVAFVADRLTPKSNASVVTSGGLAVVNDNTPASATVKLAA